MSAHELALNGKCTSNKHVLTRQMNKFQSMVEEFKTMDQNIPQLSRIWHANLLCKQVDKIRSAQKNLEEYAKN